jgi:hypothetical protein
MFNDRKKIIVCQKYFLAIIGIKRSFLRTKVLKNRSQETGEEDIKIMQKNSVFRENDIKSFVNSLLNEISHYSQNKNVKYIAPEFRSKYYRDYICYRDPKFMLKF